MEALILGNGPSLKQSFSSNFFVHKNIFACNRIYLHDFIDDFAHNTTLFLSDLSFRDNYQSMLPILKTFKCVFTPYDFGWPHYKNFRRYKIVRSDCNYYKSVLLKNITSYPLVFESCSVLFTVLLPYVLRNHEFEQFRFLGFDGTYSKKRYFYEDSYNSNFRWTKSEESEWEKDFKSEMSLLYSHTKHSTNLLFH